MIDPERITRYRKKLVYLERYYDWLRNWMDKSSLEDIEEYKNYQALMGIYHAAQNAAESIIDILSMINKDVAHLVQDNYKNLDYVIQKGILNAQLREGLKEIIGLRNRLAHDYNGIIDIYAWDTINDNLEHLNKFHEEIQKWLNHQSK